ncbi:hypothetical protein GGI06_001105 [Coemansia sp. S85]|nr:hypothetical protein GGI06_001105 [Coemansia sp. S85]
MTSTFKGLVYLEGSLPDISDDASESSSALLTNAKIARLAIYDMQHEVRAPQALTVVALASASVDSCGLKGDVFGFLNTWVLEKGASQLSQTKSQCATVPGAAFGMHLSSNLAVIEVATDKNVLAGDVLTEAARGADPSCHHGIGMPPDIGAYTGASSDFAYPNPVRTALVEQRRRMDGELFIDLLLSMAGISGAKSSSAYPPRTSAALQALIGRIGSSDLDDLKQHCLVYYLILDHSANALVSEHGLYTEGNTDPTAASAEAATYARDRLVPRNFEYLMRGYWLMDHGQTAASISYFADPSVIADWSPKILRTAVAAGAYHPAAQLLNSATALAQPRLDERPSEAPAVMEVLLHCSFARAFTFQRQRASTAPELRRALLAQMYVFALSAHSRRAVADQLASLPLDGIEEAALEEHCLSPDVPAYAKDFLALHYVNCGRYTEAIRLFKALAGAEEGMHLSDAQRRKHDERSAMVQNLTMLLPVAQRWLVQELEPGCDASGDGHIPSSVAVDKATGEPGLHDSGRSHTMDIDNAPPYDQVDDEAVARSTGIPMAVQITVPLSASKSARLLRPVVGMHGALQSPSHPLLRVLVKQMSAASTSASAVSSQPVTPSRMGDIRDARASSAQEDTPSKPSRLSNAGHTPPGRNVFAVPAATETPQVAQRVTGGFPMPTGVSRSPFEMAKVKSMAKSREPAEEINLTSPARPRPSRKARDGADASTQRYNLRNRSGLPADGPANEGHSDIGGSDATQPKASTSGSKEDQNTPVPKARSRTRQPKPADPDELAALSKRSAASYERSARSSDTTAAKPTSRTRKRE